MRRLEQSHLKPIREHVLNMSQRRFSKMVGISQTHFHMIENGQRNLTNYQREKIEKAVFQIVDRATLFYLLDKYEEEKKNILQERENEK